MSDITGRFVWYELMTTDLDAAERFYADVIGWSTRDAGMGGPRYTIASTGASTGASAGDRMVAGMMAVPDHLRDSGIRPHWIGYIACPDVDAYAARVAERGGRIHRAPDDIPGVGRFAVVADPQGAAFVLFKGAGDAEPAAPAKRPASRRKASA